MGLHLGTATVPQAWGRSTKNWNKNKSSAWYDYSIARVSIYVHRAKRCWSSLQNRLLLQIRDSQAQLQAIRESVASSSQVDTSATGEITPPIERIVYTYPPADHPSNFPPGTQIPRPTSPVLRGSRELSRQSSRRSQTPSRTGSPSLRSRPASAGMYAQGDDFFYSGPGGSLTDSNDYYRAETQNLTRENQMLRQRIRELGMLVAWV